MTDVWFLRQALADLRAAHSWYEEQRPGLGDEFADVVDAAVESIIAFPAARPVVATLHVALDPKRHQSRLRG